MDHISSKALGEDPPHSVNHNMRSASKRTLLGVLLIGVFVLRLAFCAGTTGLGRSLGKDYREYIVTGQRLLEQGTLTSPFITSDSTTTPSALLPPLYAGLVAAVYRLLGTETFLATLALQVLNAIATSMTVLFVFLIARRVGGVRAAWIAALLAAINPMLIGFTTYIWDTNVFCFGVVFGVWLAIHLSDKPIGWPGWLGFGLYLGALALLNPALTIAYPLLVLWPLSKTHGWRFRAMLGPIGMTLCGWLVAVMPWTVRNYVHFGELMYIRSGLMHELWLGVCPEADTNPAAIFRRQSPLQDGEAQHRIASIGEQAYIKECSRHARAAISANPWRFVRLVALRTTDYWAGTLFSHRRPGGTGWPQSPTRLAVMLFLQIEGFAIVVCLLARRKISPDLRWLLAIVLLFSLVYCVTHVQLRFRAPIEPIMAVLAAISVTDMVGAVRSRRVLSADTSAVDNDYST